MGVRAADAIVVMGRKREWGFLLEIGWLGGNEPGMEIKL